MASGNVQNKLIKQLTKPFNNSWFCVEIINKICNINTSKISGELSRVSMISSRVKITCCFTRENNMLFSQVRKIPIAMVIYNPSNSFARTRMV